MTQKLSYCLLIILTLLLSCSIDPVAGGSASEGEAKIAGHVVNENMQPAESTVVTLRNIIITPEGETILSEKTATTDASGMFTIEQIKEGKYVLYCEDKTNSLSAVFAKLTIGENSVVSLDKIQLKPFTILKGRVLTKTNSNIITENIKVCIPGIGSNTTLNNDGFYVLANVPEGHYDITLLYGNTANFLPVTIENDASQDIIFIRDVYFATDIKDADNVYSFYPHQLDYTFSIVPKKYAMDQIPSWYIGKDFSYARYYEVVNDTLKPIWRFSLIVGVSDSMVQHYGDLEAVKILIANQLDSVNNVYNEPDVFDGTLEFTVDSVYQFSGTGNDQIALPPSGFNYRVIFDEAPPPDQFYWYGASRSIYHYYRPDVDNGLFGTYSMENLAWELGLARGCVILKHLDVRAENNSINNQGYKGEQCFMYDCHDGRTWDYYSINIINFYKDEVFSKAELIPQAIPSSLGVVTSLGSGEPVSGSEIDLYGVKWETYAVAEPPVLSGTTDSKGEFVFPKNPFLATSKDTIEYTNFLIKAVHGQDTAYTWMPLNEVGSAWFANPDTVFRSNIKFTH